MKRLLIAVAKLIVYVVAVWGVARVAAMPFKMHLGRLRDLDTEVQIALIGLVLAIGVCVVNVLMIRFGKSQLIKAGWPAPRDFLRGIGFGALVGLAMCGGMLLLTVLTGGAHFAAQEGNFADYLARVLPLLGCLALAALGEELIFRGYPLTVLAHVLGRGWANLLLAVLFTAAHAAEAGFDSLIAINIIAGSLVVGTLRFTPGGIPAAWGFHFVWNSVQMLAGSTLSGEYYHVPMIRLANEGPALFSGGAFGPEGGIGATIATVLVLALLTRYCRRNDLPDLPFPLRLRGHQSSADSRLST